MLNYNFLTASRQPTLQIFNVGGKFAPIGIFASPISARPQHFQGFKVPELGRGLQMKYAVILI